MFIRLPKFKLLLTTVVTCKYIRIYKKKNNCCVLLKEKCSEGKDAIHK